MCRKESTEQSWLLIFRKASDEVGLGLAFGDLDFRRVPNHLTDKGALTAPKLLMKTIWFLLNTSFPSGSLEFWQVPGTGCLRDLPLIKILGTESLITFAVWQYFTGVTTLMAGRMKHVLCDSTERTWFPLDFTPGAFSLC